MNNKNNFRCDLNRLSNDQLLVSLENQFSLERKTSHYILLHLKEIARRRLYAQRGYSNLREMLIKYFQQSETAANQRLKSLELMLAVPVVEERLISGDLNMTTVAMAQRQILREEKLTGQELSKEKKTEIVESITNKTMANAEIELFKLLPETASHPATFERRVSEHATRLNLTLPNDVMEMFIRLKELWAHVDPTMDYVEVIRRSFKMTLQKIDPARKKSHIKKDRTQTSKQTANLNQPAIHKNPTQSLTDSVKHRGTKRPTYYSKQLDRALWERAQYRCEFVDEKTGRRCECRSQLQREHVLPLALGGTNDLSNMQLLCATHNQLRARQVFGNNKIDAFQTRKGGA